MWCEFGSNYWKCSNSLQTSRKRRRQKDYFGIICDKPCSKNCKETEDDSPICDIENGICYSCKDTFYGEQCTDECKPNCKQCNQTTGICLECFSDYYLSENNECMKCRDTCDQCDKDKCISCIYLY